MNKIIKIALLVFGAIGALLICIALALNITTKNEIYSADIALHANMQNKIEGEIRFEKFAPLLRSKRIANIKISKYDLDNNIAESSVKIEQSGRKIYITILDKNALDSAKNKKFAESAQKSTSDSVNTLDFANAPDSADSAPKFAESSKFGCCKC